MSAGVRRALQGLVGAAAMIAAITVVSRVLGLVRTIVQASTVGTEAINDAYSAANLLPNVLFEIAAGGALAGAVIPLLAAPVARADRDQVARVVSAALGWVLLVLLPVGVLLAALSGVVGSYAGDDPVMASTVRFFVLVFAVQVPVYGVTVLLYGVLQAHKRFFWPAFAPVLNSVVLIATFAVYGAMADGETSDPTALAAGALDVLAWGTTAGVVAMCLPVIGPVRRLGVRLTPTLRFPGDAATRFRALALAGVGSVAAQQVSVLVVWLMANGLLPHDGRGFSAVVYSQQIYLLPYAVLVVPLATSTFPRVAAYAAAGDAVRFARMSAVTTRAVLAVGALGGAAVLAAAAAVATVFARVSPGADGVIGAMTVLLTWMAPGVVGLAVMFHVSRTLYAVERPRAAVAANVVGWGSVAVLAPVLLLVTGTDGSAVLRAIGLATSLGMTAGGIAAVVVLRRAAGTAALSGMLRTAVVALVAAGAGAVAGRAVASTVLDLVGDDVWSATGAAAGAAVVAATVVAAAVMVLDPGTLRGVVAVEPAPVPPTGGVRR
ncbi:murein biosynthesis integral membrane protein MurJ [Cellulomonas dongxiuzhuiae]|uniref:Virulence factor MviN n=1 Tax=Cellulomonas dongxiuzhuiae TaxID=2819979 RepID=A0ABX8GQD1_9CELL|nr:lipid II flippase MurJ [Cellulomonas dongxiuzhuiae]MBO3093219.1 virulence factor MviN [Cellulomonas dongxiuzhuiae]QWC17509.1 virulence factor MviN [Cellulomonas dongxiuzhuiae]